MPGRVSVRAARSATTRAKPRNTEASEEVPDEGPVTSLRQNICDIFGDVQRSNTGHRKLIITLRKLQEWCCYEPVSGRSSTANEDYDENDFNAEMCRCMLRVLSIRKSEPAGDRVVKFTGAFLRHATESGTPSEEFLTTVMTDTVCRQCYISSGRSKRSRSHS